LRNLPQHIMDDGLQEQLQPFMRRLSIVHYMAEKQRNKNFGHVTFLHEEDGKKFLRHHGEESGPPPHGLSSTPGKHVSRTRARLTLMGKPVFCKQSNRPPNRLVLGYISQRASQRDRSNETPGEPFKVLSAVELSCGHYTFRDGRLFFTAEWTTKERCDVKFTKRSLRITIIERRIELRIPFGGIVELLCKFTSDSRAIFTNYGGVHGAQAWGEWRLTHCHRVGRWHCRSNTTLGSNHPCQDASGVIASDDSP
jgi:RNA recognition motif-containing protein